MTSLQDACKTQGCRTGVSHLNVSIDASVAPCTDRYGYVCGNWRVQDPAGLRPSYAQHISDTYASSVYSWYTCLSANPCVSTHSLSKPACVFAPSVAFTTKRSSNLRQWVAAGMNTAEWLQGQTFSALFTLMIHNILNTSLRSVLKLYGETRRTTI